jgi:hypothetical protein
LDNLLESIAVSDIVRKHIDKCRSYEPFKHSKAVVIIEANMSSHGLHLLSNLREMGIPNTTFLVEDNNKSNSIKRDFPGSITTRKNKIEMCYLLIDKYLKPGNIGFNQPFIIANHERTMVDDIKGEIITELKAFQKKKIATKMRDGNIEYEIYFSGKSKGNDDYVIALALGCYWREVFLKDRKYEADW